MTKSNGIKSLKQAAKLLNKHAPDGESLAYINPEEGRVLRARGGSGIMTVAGVPTYGILDWITDTALPWVGEKVGDLVGGRYSDQPAVYKGDKMIERAQSGLGNLARDAFSVWGALKAKKDQEGLNEAEMAQFNKLNAQLSAAKTELEVSTDFGTQLKAPQNVPETIEDVSTFTDVTLPTMKTTAVAQGGRIGYNLGGIDTPFQGIGALNPRMGYQMGSPHGQAIPTFSEGVEQMYESGPAGVDTETINWERESPYGAIADLLKGTGVQESETTDYNTVPYPVIREKMKSYAGMIGSDNIYDIIKIATQVGDKEFVDYLRKTFTAEGNQWIEDPGMEWKESKQWGALGAAHGGRIGAAGGGIMPLLNMGGMEKDYRQDGGFVPIGRKEKADDVPARLSKNEFVFTADAVRAAGGGDIDQGAQRMYNVMKNLEAGGQISQQSQGKR